MKAVFVCSQAAARIMNPRGGTVTGSDTYEEGESVTVRAIPANGYKFAGWTEDGRTVNTNSSYTFQAVANRTLTTINGEVSVNIGG